MQGGAGERRRQVKTQREQPIIIVRKRARGHGGHHGGAWKVAFADFMTAMMAIFLVLWLVSLSSDVKAAIAGYFQDPLGRANEFGSSIIPGQGAQAAQPRPLTQAEIVNARRDRLMKLAEQIRRELPEALEVPELAAHVDIELVAEGLRISLVEDSTDVFFASGRPEPLPTAVELLTALGYELREAAYPIVVEGHTDAQPYVGRGAYSNWELSADRANAARRLLSGGGVPESRIAAVRGLADREPRMADTFAPQNRRVTILLQLPSLQGDSLLPVLP